MNIIDPSTIKQLLQLQLLNQMDLITSGSNPDHNTSDAGPDFATMLQSLLAGQNPESAAVSGSKSIAALSAVGATGMAGGLGLANFISSPYASSLAAGAVKPAILRGRTGFASDPAVGKPASYTPLIEQASAAFGVDSSLVKAVIHQESSFNPYAESPAGAKGLMQLMDDTGNGLGVTDPFDPQQNVHAGTRFLSDLLHKYKGNEGVALAAYNAGPGRVDRLGIRTDADLVQKLYLLPQETQHYVSRVLGLKQQYAAAN